jgi:hypothetical protein
MYTYLIKEQIQVGGEVRLGSVSGKGYSYSNTKIFGLGVYNFSPMINDSFFAFGGLGIATGQATDLKGSETKFGFEFGAGKRFPLMAKLHYSPMVWLEKVGDGDPVLTIKALNFSVIF